MLILLIEANRQLSPLKKDKLQTKHNEHFYKCTLNKKYVPTIEVPFFYKLNLKKVNENSAKHYIFKKVINQQDFFRRKTNYTTCTTYVLKYLAYVN